MINCTKINLDNKSVNDTLTTDLERYKEQVKVLKDGQNVDLKSNDNVSDSSAQSVEIDRLEQTLSEHLKEKESLMQTVTLLKNDFKKEESRNIDREIALEKRIQKPRLNICYEIPDSKRPLLLADEIVRKEQEQGLTVTALKDELRKLKGKGLADNVISKHTTDPEMLKIDVEYLNPRLLNNRLAHSNYLKHTQEEAAILREIWNYYEKADILMNHFVAILYSTNGVIQRTEAVATTCYTQNRSIIRRLHGKTPYELLHDKLPDLSFFYVFGALCYPTNDSENLGKLQPKVDIGLMPNPPPSTSFVPPSRTDWDILFQPLFDELLTPPPSVDHPAPEVIAPIVDSLPVSTKLQLYEQALFCYYDAVLTSVEPKNYKDALTRACWIKAMQEKLNEFERLEVWELVPRPDKVMVITLKWIYKVKLDELRGILKNKARLVARGYRQEEGINFEESFALVARS
ncbi:retrovirus-related pol polyprotein from transposon TNT 1-94 [Tanacetum coccineum]